MSSPEFLNRTELTVHSLRFKWHHLPCCLLPWDRSLPIEPHSLQVGEEASRSLTVWRMFR